MIDLEEATRLYNEAEEINSWFIPGLSDSDPYPKEDIQVLLKKAAELGSEDAYYHMIFDSEEQKTDFLKDLAYKNIPYACYHYSKYLLIYGSKELYVYWLKRAAGLGYPKAECEVGSMYLRGYILEQDFFTGLTYLNKASENNNVDALLCLSELYEKGCFGNIEKLEIIEKNPLLAFKLKEKAARLGDKESILWLSNSYFEGKIVPCDIAKSNELLESLVGTDHERFFDDKEKKAAAILAYRYEKGIGYAKDIQKAISYYRVALCDQYFPDADILKHIAKLYENIAEIDSAQSCYKSALSDLQPEINGDILYEYLLFLDKYKCCDNNVKKYLGKCADQAKQSYECTYCLAMCYLNGIGVSQDLKQAKYYLAECNRWAQLSTYKKERFPIIVNSNGSK